MKSSIYGYNSNNDKLVMLVALCYTKDINCLIYIFFSPPLSVDLWSRE